MMAFDPVVNDVGADVEQTYRTLLDQGDWRVTGVRGPEIDFTRRSNPTLKGTLTVFKSKDGENIRLTLRG